MRLIGFGFDKISIEKLKDQVKELKVTTNIDITDVIEIPTEVKKAKEELMKVKFSYSVKYEPELANLNMGGNVFLAVEEEKAKEILKDWKKKKISEEFRLAMFNLIVKKSTSKALSLEEEMGLPAHIPLPLFKAQKEK